MIWRLLVTLGLLSGLAFYLHGLQQRGRFSAVDEGFLDFLLSNSRSSFTPAADAGVEVVHVQMRVEEKGEYAAWPPAPVDYQMLLKALRGAQPSVVLFTEEMAWPGADAEAVAQLAEGLLEFPCVFSAPVGGEAVRFDGKDGVLALFQSQRGGACLQLKQQPVAPHEGIRRLGDVGVILPAAAGGAEAAVPMAYGLAQGAILRASSTLLALLRATQSGLTETRLSFGPGAKALLPAGLCLPLEPDGVLRPLPAVPGVNALDLMTLDSVTDEEAKVLQTKLGTGRAVVIGSSAAEARALQHALAIPRFQPLGYYAQLVVCGVVALVGCSLLWLPRGRAPLRALLYLFLAVVASLLSFQLFQWWSSPTVPGALLLAAGGLARLLGRRPGAGAAAGALTLRL